VVPVTKVAAAIDDLSVSFKSTLKRLNLVAQIAYRNYDAKAMHGLPVGVQIVGRRLEEEKVLEGMKIVETLLKTNGQEYELMEL
jgi:Asp-tRNA(Asn)/Glu-tRNA(Gln) amidotransferase A subunit family amidase